MYLDDSWFLLNVTLKLYNIMLLILNAVDSMYVAVVKEQFPNHSGGCN